MPGAWQLPEILQVAHDIKIAADFCPACGDDIQDVMVDGLLKLKHCRQAQGSATLVADTLFFVSSEEVEQYAKADTEKVRRVPSAGPPRSKEARIDVFQSHQQVVWAGWMYCGWAIAGAHRGAMCEDAGINGFGTGRERL